jgi:hypothetical protein
LERRVAGGLMDTGETWSIADVGGQVPPDALQRATVARPHQPRDAALAQGVGHVRVQHARAQQAARLPQRRVGRREGAGVDPYPSPAAQACPNDSCECSQPVTNCIPQLSSFWQLDHLGPKPKSPLGGCVHLLPNPPSAPPSSPLLRRRLRRPSS